MGAFGASLGSLGEVLGGLGGLSGTSWGPLGGSWGPLGGSLGSLGSLLEYLWGLFGSLGRTLGASWAILGTLCGVFGVTWGVFGAFWEPSGCQNVPKRLPRASRMSPSTLVGVFRPRHGGGLPPPTPSAGHFRRICGETLKKSREKPPFRKTLEPHTGPQVPNSPVNLGMFEIFHRIFQ